MFYDRHAVLGYAECFNQLDDLKEIDWRIFFEPPVEGGYARYWQDRQDSNHPHWSSRREIRQAEFLVYEELDFTLIEEIAVNNQSIRVRVIDALQDTAYDHSVTVEPAWYF